MEITDMKRGTTFLGYYIEPETGCRDIFEGIILSTEKVRQYENQKVSDILKADVETVVIKSDNPKHIGKMEAMFWTERDLSKFQVSPTHFVSMENIYPILHTYNQSDEYDSIRIAQFDNEWYSIPINSLMYEEGPNHTVAMLKMGNGHIVQMIVLQDISCNPEYENPFIWMNIVKNENELVLPCDVRNFVSNSFITHYQNITVTDIYNNQKLYAFFGSAFAPNPQELSHFKGLGIIKDDMIETIIFDTSSEEERVNWGNGVSVKYN